jgi:AcrR family transcriptional regulator
VIETTAAAKPARGVAGRREAKTAAIVAEAWVLAAEHGIGGVSLHALAKAVGMRQPSLYAYFDSKLALYDAMFADGNRQLIEGLDALALPTAPRAAVKAFMHAFVDFAVADAARSELLFHRPIPGFEPSPEAYAYAEVPLSRAGELLAAAGMTDPADVDCMVAMVAGIVDAQSANDPGGDRWIRHLDRLIDLYLDDANTRTRRSGAVPGGRDGGAESTGIRRRKRR